MSLMDMNRGFKKYAPWVMGALAIPFLGSVVLSGLGSSISTGNGGGATQANGGANAGEGDPVVAKVGDMSVTRSQLDRRLEPLLRQQGSMASPTQMDQYRYMMLTAPFPQSVKQTAALVAAAKAKGITVSDDAIAAEREKVWAQQRPQLAAVLGLDAKATDSDINAALQKQQPGASIAVFKAQIPDDDLRNQLYQEGLIAALKKEADVNENTVKQSYNEVQVRHILIASGDKGLPDAQAKAKAEKILAEVKANPAKMAELAKQFTDDPGSKATGGLYTWAPASRYVSAFSKAALEAGVGKVYPEPVKTQFGYHIIKSEGVRPGKDFPKDWDKNKQKYIDEAAEREAQQKLTAAITEQADKIKVEITDPGIRAAQLETEAQEAMQKSPGNPKAGDAKLEEALTELAKVPKAEDRLGAIPLRKAAILTKLDRNKDAIAAYEEALQYRKTADARVTLAGLYLKEKDKANALKQLDEAQKLLIADSTLMGKVSSLYAQAGDPAKSKAASEKAAQMRKQEQAQQQAQIDAQIKAMAANRPSPAPAASAAAAVPPGPKTTAASPVPSASPAVSASPAASSPAPSPSATAPAPSPAAAPR